MIRKAMFPLLLLILMLSAAAVQGGEDSHQVMLRDGSVLKGRVLSLDAKELVLATRFDDALRIPRDQIAGIAFTAMAAMAPARQTEAGEPTLSEPPPPAGEGLLEVAIKGDAIRSSARYRQRKDRERAEQLNVIHLNIIVDGRVVHEEADPTIEKDFQDRGWIFLRNHHHFATASIPLPAGKHRVQIVVGNQLDLKKQGEKQPGLVSAELDIPEILIRPGEKTRIAIEGKSKGLNYGNYELQLLSRF